MTPRRVPRAADAEKAVPCSRARNTRTGPDVSGRPMIRPPTELPHFLEAKLTARTSTGTVISLTTRRGQSSSGTSHASGRPLDILADPRAGSMSQPSPGGTNL
jgi:hypothetical protein